METITIEIDNELMETLRSMGQEWGSLDDITRKLVVDAPYIEFIAECNGIVENEENRTGIDDL